MDNPTWQAEGAAVSVRYVEPTRIQILRVRRPTEATRRALGTLFGTILPTKANQAYGDAPRIMSLAPDEWMLVGNVVEDERILGAIVGAAAIHVADVTDGRVVYEVSGDQARSLIAKGCTLDLHPRTFGGVNRCALSVLAQVPILIDQTGNGPVFNIYADASYAHHLECWFEDAVIEFHHEEIM